MTKTLPQNQKNQGSSRENEKDTHRSPSGNKSPQQDRDNESSRNDRDENKRSGNY